MISLIALARALYPVCAWTHGAGVSPPPPGIPVNTALPTIGSTTQVGVATTSSNGSWTNSPNSYTYQWYKEGAAIVGATSQTYTPATVDIGCLLQVAVVASNINGSSLLPAFSALIDPTIGATVFYVSSSTGLDTNAGTLAAPWKTLAHVNAHTFVGGTSVLFKRGDTWRNDGCATSSGAQLSPSSSGGTGNPIVFDAYGTGANPAIDGSLDLSTTGAWQASGTTKERQSVHTFNGFANPNGKPNNAADDPGNLIWGITAVGGTNVPPALVNAHYGVMAGTGFNNIWWASGQAGLTATGQWNFNTTTNKIQVYCVGNPATNLPGVTGDLRAAIDTCCIYFNQQSNITFQNFTIQYSGATAIDTGGAGGTCNNITIRDMVVQWIGGGTISGNSNGDSRYGDGWDIEGSCSGMMMDRIWWHQIYDTGPGPQCGGGPHQDNITVRNNVCTDCGAFFSSFFLGGIPTANGLYIYNNTVYCTQNCWSNFPAPGQRPNNPGPGYEENVTALVVDTVNYDATSHVVTLQSNMSIENNIFAGIGGIGGSPGFGIVGAGGWNVGGGVNASNPFTGSGPSGSGPWLNYNCWPVNINGGGAQQIALTSGNYAMANWVKGTNIGGAGTFTPALEVNGIFSQDPLFVSQSGLNFSLQPGSPCRLAGANLQSLGVVWDFNHNPRPSTGNFSMGAFQ